jgi:protein PET117
MNLTLHPSNILLLGPPGSMSGSHRAKAVLGVSVLFCGFSIWAVHWLQNYEREVGGLQDLKARLTSRLQTMYQGVIRDDKRRADKLKKREEDMKESAKKREVYESVQRVSTAVER